MHKTKKKIVETALDLFMVQGYVSTSLDLIIEKTGLSKGALYHHFSSKDAIANESLRYFFKSFHDQAVQIVTSDKPALEKFSEISKTKFALMKGQEMALFELFYHLRDSDIRSKLIRQNRKDFTPILTSIVEQGVKEGSFQPLVSPEHVAHFIFSLHEGGDFVLEEDFKDKQKMKAYKQDLERAIGMLLGVGDYVCSE